MMKPGFRVLGSGFGVLLLCSLYCALFTISYAQTISSSELINKAKDYDGKAVTYAGEVIGDIMRRGEYAWVNFNDGEQAIGIWAKAALLRDISYTGGFKAKGDIVEVSGIFNRACPEHGGDLDIHALAITKVDSGRPWEERLNPDKKQIVFILLGALILVWILSLFLRR
ncbi:MAG: DNA-binding protein [Candidatus Omnitrophota bacterium]